MSPATRHGDLNQHALAVELIQGHPAVQPGARRLKLSDAALLTLLLSIDLFAWCFVLLRGAQALLG